MMGEFLLEKYRSLDDRQRLLIAIAFFICAFLFFAASYSPRYLRDNVLEQEVEKIILSESGINVDLSPQELGN